jgi:mRNA interferase ChpB
MLTIPPSLLDELNLHAGSTVSAEVKEGRLVVEHTKPRYTLEELLAQCVVGDQTPNGGRAGVASRACCRPGDHLKRGEIYLVSLDPATGHEQQRTRPVLILTDEAFNKFTQVPLIAPITNGVDSARRAGFTVPLIGAGLRTTGVVRCDQIRTMDIIARGGRRLEVAPEAIVT